MANVFLKQSTYYTVTWKINSTIVKTEKVDLNDSAIPPTFEEYGQYVPEGYYLSGWDKEFNDITSNLTINSILTLHTYAVRFINPINGTIMKEQQVVYGGSATAPTTHSSIPAGKYISGWDKPYTNIKQNTDVMAILSTKTYTVIFKVQDTTVSTQIIEHGKSATPPTDPPVPVGYGVTGWTGDYTNVTSDRTITAKIGRAHV